MKTSLILISMLLCQTTVAETSGWLFSRDTETATASDTPETGRPSIPSVAKPDLGKPTDKKKDPKAAKPKCASSFKEAQGLFKEVYGSDVDLTRMGQFNGSLKSFTSVNQFKNKGSLWLNMNIQGMINTDVPVCVLKSEDGKSLTATLIISSAVTAGTRTLEPTIKGFVDSKEAPRSIRMSITRSGKQMNFTGNGAQATAAIR